MDSVKIEITAKGWETTVVINDKKYVEKHRRTESGSKSYEGNLEDVDEIPEELTDVLRGFFCHDVMRTLSEVSG